jgi:hypothetical protein
MSHRLIRSTCTGACLAIAAASSSAQTTYFVATTGSDASSGLSEQAAWRTLQHGASLVHAGDTVIVLPGTYAGFNIGEANSGTPGAPITFHAQPGVIVNTAASRFNGQTHHARINMDTTSWIVIEGFEVVGTNDQRDSVAGVRSVCPPDSPTGHITIRNCHIHDHGKWGIFTGHSNGVVAENNLIHDIAEQHGIYFSNSGDGHVARNNVIHHCASQGVHVNSDAGQGGDGVIRNVLIESNTIWEMSIGGPYIDGSGVARVSPGGGSAINFDGVQDSTIRNNLLYSNHASGISLYRIDGLLPASNNVVANNTILNGSPANTNSRWCVNIADASIGNTLLNNILLNYHSFRGSLIITTDALAGFTSDHNVVMDRIGVDDDVLTLAQWRSASGQDAHSFAVPAAQWATLFTSLAGNDYTLPASSPAVDAGGASLAGHAAPPTDLLGTPRPAGPAFDIGAYERPVKGPLCPADFNGDGVVNSTDVSDFINAWFEDLAAGTLITDWDRNGVVNSTDVSEFINDWFVDTAAGCG